MMINRWFKRSVPIGIALITTVSLWNWNSMATPPKQHRRFPLIVVPGQLVTEFAAANADVPVFQSPVHPVAGSGLPFFNLTQVVVTGPNLDEPLVLPSRANSGSAVAFFNIHDLDWKEGDPDVVQSIDFRPYASNNSVAITQELVRQFFDLIAARPDCQRIETKGNDLGKSIIKQYSGNWPSEPLSEVLVNPKTHYFYAKETVRCGGVQLILEVMPPFRLNDAAPEMRGFDVLIFIRPAQAS